MPSNSSGADTPENTPPASLSGEEEEFLPQYQITDVPIIPKEILSEIRYPPLAERQGIEATVYLELYIDSSGTIRRISVLKDPGYGFAEAAVDALTGLVCTPAKINGEPVAVRYRHPVVFRRN